MTPPTTDQTKTFHTRWQQLTGLDLPYDLSRHFAWEIWIAKGLTVADLESLVSYIKKRIKAGRREKESLMFRNMVNNVDNALEDISIARAETRNERIQTPRQRVLAQSGRPSVTDTPAKSTEQILREAVALKAFQEWKQQNL